MTEISRPWAGTTIGDAGPYTAPHWWDVWQAMIGGSGALCGTGNKGVFSGVGGDLAVSYVAPNTLHVEIGSALVDGLFYNNDAVFSATMSSATAGNVRDDRLVVRKYFSGLIQTARITLLPGSEAASPGPGTPPALVQDTTRQTHWDLPLARVSISELGVITVTDERQLIYGSDVVKLKETVVGGGGSVVSWTGIPQGFRHLEIIWQARAVDAVIGVSSIMRLRFNGDSGNNYNNNYLQGYNPTNVVFGLTAADPYIDVGSMASSNMVNPAGESGSGKIIIPNYSGATFYKTLHSIQGKNNPSSATSILTTSEWNSTSPITSISMYAEGANPNFSAGSVFTLYGYM